MLVYASLSMGLLDVLVSPAGLSTFASCADLERILLNPALRHEIFPIVTPVLWERDIWHSLISLFSQFIVPLCMKSYGCD
jgi:hypothetical protein